MSMGVSVRARAPAPTPAAARARPGYDHEPGGHRRDGERQPYEKEKREPQRRHGPADAIGHRLHDAEQEGQADGEDEAGSDHAGHIKAEQPPAHRMNRHAGTIAVRFRLKPRLVVHAASLAAHGRKASL